MTDLMSLIHQAGFTGAAANTMYGIVMAESGGNAQAHNTNASTGDNSYGLAQINMLGSMGPARLAQFGIKSNTDLFDPLTNLKAAYALSGGGKDFTPWTTFTSGAYKNAAPGAVVSNTGSGGTTGSTLAQPEMTPQQKEQALIDGAGPLGALLTKIPELHGLLVDAVTRGLTDKEFANEVTNSQWYRTHGDAVRQSMIMQYSDPATYQQQLNAAARKVTATMQDMGVGMSGMTNAEYVSLAKQVQMGTITDQDLQKQLATLFGAGTGKYGQNYKEGSATGTAAQYDTQLRTMYAQYGQTLQPGQIAYKIQQLLAGNTKIEQYEEQAKVAAKAMFPGLSSSIDQGMTVKDLAQPYIQSMSNILELDPNSIGLNDRMVKAALQGTGATAKGQPPTATPIWQFEQQLRADPRWQYTVNAHNDTASVLSQLGKDWGYSS